MADLQKILNTDSVKDKRDKYALIVGNGDLPAVVIKALEEQNADFIVVSIKGLSPNYLSKRYKGFSFYIGEVASLINNLKLNNVNKVILVGNITRPSLFAIRWDALGKSILQAHLSKIHGDNSILSLVLKIFEDNGFSVVAPQSIAPEILAAEKIYTAAKPLHSSYQDVLEGFKLAKELSVFDVGQSMVYQQNMVIALEAVEGTAEMIKRSAKLIKKNGQKAILIKIQKTNQDVRVDMPTIGPLTIKQMKKANICGIVIEANSTIILDKELTIKLANKYGIFIVALAEENLNTAIFN